MPVCDACDDEISADHAAGACGACGKPVESATCPWCDGLGMGPIKRVVRLAPFDGVVRDLVHHAKFRGRWELATWLGHRLGQTASAKALLGDPDVTIVPVPLHPHRRALRGYDQAQLIALAAGKACGVRVIEALTRVRSTAPQTALTSVAARRTNVRDAFKICPGICTTGQTVVLMDDVMTTGATLRAAARVMESASAARISALVVGVADPRRDGFESV